MADRITLERAQNGFTARTSSDTDMKPPSVHVFGDPQALAGHVMKSFAGKSAKVSGRMKMPGALDKRKLLRPTKIGGVK